MSTEDSARKEYAEAGVDLAELKEEEKKEEPKPEAEKPKVPPTDQAPADDPQDEPQGEAPKDDAPPEQRKRSIYEEYKEKKAELKTEKERAEQAERERDELQKQLDDLKNAPSDDKGEAADEIEAYAKQIGADPQLIRSLIALAQKGMKAEVPADILTDLAEFKSWKAQNSKAIEAAEFEREFKATLPAINELLPNATPQELDAIKAEVDRLSHTKAFHDKSLAYVVFENRKTLGTLISPKKPGIEQKGRVDSDKVEFEFDPNADISKMTAQQLEQWEKAYREAGTTTGLNTDAEGRKSIL